MNHLLNLLKAFGIVLGWYLLVFSGIWAMMFIRDGRAGVVGGHILISPLIFLITAFLVSLAFGALYLPPQGRLYAAIGALLLTIALWVYTGIQIFNPPNT